MTGASPQERTQVEARVLAGRYRVDGLLGEGGMGSVFAATELALERKVAVKLLAPALAQEPEFVARFQREARLLARFDHPALVPLLAVDTHEGVPLLVMKFIEGKTLSKVLTERRRLAVRQALPVLHQLCGALDYLHARGVVHRDLKPGNLMLDDDGRLTVLDFGISQHRDAARLTVPGMFVGTPLYMAPEQITADTCGPAADLYALALLTWHLLVGEHPFGTAGDDAGDLLSRQVHATPTLAHRANPAVPAPVARVIDRSLDKDPAARHPTAAAFYEATSWMRCRPLRSRSSRGARGSEPARVGKSTAGGGSFSHAGAGARPGGLRVPLRRTERRRKGACRPGTCD